MALSIITSEGPLGAGNGHGRTLVWNDERGAHKVYVFGYSSKNDAEEAAKVAARENGYIEKSWWQFWR